MNSGVTQLKKKKSYFLNLIKQEEKADKQMSCLNQLWSKTLRKGMSFYATRAQGDHLRFELLGSYSQNTNLSFLL